MGKRVCAEMAGWHPKSWAAHAHWLGWELSRDISTWETWCGSYRSCLLSYRQIFTNGWSWVTCFRPLVTLSALGTYFSSVLIDVLELCCPHLCESKEPDRLLKDLLETV